MDSGPRFKRVAPPHKGLNMKLLLLIPLLIVLNNCKSSTTSIRSKGGVVDPPPAKIIPTPTPTPEKPPNTPPVVTPSPGKAIAIVAQGHMGRSIISCDDGKTWFADRSWVTEGDEMVCGNRTPVRCGSTSCTIKSSSGGCTTPEVQASCDCGHNTGFGKGVVFAQGKILATYGWGRPGKVLRSSNGIDWETAVTYNYSDHGGIGYAQNTFVLATVTPKLSADSITWANGPKADYREFADANDTVGKQLWSVRNFITYTYLGQERFLGISDGDILISADGAKTWVRPQTLAKECGRGKAVAGNNIVLTFSGGYICRSTDGGMNWTRQQVGYSLSSFGVWTGSHFLIWGHWTDRPSNSTTVNDGYNMYKSTDGLNWEKFKMVTKTAISAVVHTPKGTLVAANGTDSTYGNQKFLFSKDGLTWSEGNQTTPTDDRHGITNMSVGEVNATNLCPSETN